MMTSWLGALNSGALQPQGSEPFVFPSKSARSPLDHDPTDDLNPAFGEIRMETTDTGAERSSHALRRDTPCDALAAVMGADG